MIVLNSRNPVHFEISHFNNNLTIDFTQKTTLNAVIIACLNKTKRSIEMFELLQAFLKHTTTHQNFVCLTPAVRPGFGRCGAPKITRMDCLLCPI